MTFRDLLPSNGPFDPLLRMGFEWVLKPRFKTTFKMGMVPSFEWASIPLSNVVLKGLSETYLTLQWISTLKSLLKWSNPTMDINPI